MTDQATPAATQAVTIIFNGKAGSEEAARLRDNIADSLTVLERKIQFVDICSSVSCDQAVRAAKTAGALVVAAGGDGTVNAVATLCCRHGVPLGIIPLGTFNYFARELGIPTDLAGAADVLIHGRLQGVAVG